MRLFLLLLFVSSSALADEWTSADTKREAVFFGLLAIDYKQTLAIPNLCNARGVCAYELNPILGKYPHEDRVALYFAGSAILHYVIASSLPAEYRKIFQYVTIGAQGGFVLRNWHVGVKVRF